jgi:quinol---cytochrome c reductase iron-sulfur subunit, bacillus type
VDATEAPQPDKEDPLLESPSTAAENGRRSFLAQVIGACVAFLAVLLGIPAGVAAVGPALRRESAEWLSLGPPESFQEGVPKAVNLTVVSRDGWIETTVIKGVWVIRETGDQFTAWNGRCTHLGCAYSWQTEQHQFACPCHAGVFAIDGNVLAGPPPRSLDTLPTRVVGDDLQVQYQDFRLGIADKVPV